MIFLTDGTTFIGPYKPGDPAIARGTRTLREGHGAADVYAVDGDTLEQARQAWRRAERKAVPAG
jgi:hypothetical protein